MSTEPVKTEQHERGSGSIYQRGAVYWIRYSRRGKDHRESSKSTNEADARKLLDRRLKEIWADRHGLQAFIPKAEKIFVEELLDALEKDYSLKGGRALPQFNAHLKPIREEFDEMRAVDVSAAKVDRYIDRRLKEGKAPTTVNRETQLLGQAFKLALENEQLVTAPHIRRMPERNVRTGFFERAEFDAVVAALPVYLQDFTRFAAMSGWRKGEVSSLTWGDVDREGGIIQLRGEHAKNGHARKLALEGELGEIIERCWEGREHQTDDGTARLSLYVFHREGRPVGDIRKSWATACAAAGVTKPKIDRRSGKPVMVIVEGKEQALMVPSRMFHDLRRTAVRNMVRAGVREGVAMAISGHRTRSVFDRYNITSEDDLRQAVILTQRHVEAQPAKRKVVAISGRM